MSDKSWRFTKWFYPDGKVVRHSEISRKMAKGMGLPVGLTDIYVKVIIWCLRSELRLSRQVTIPAFGTISHRHKREGRRWMNRKKGEDFFLTRPIRAFFFRLRKELRPYFEKNPPTFERDPRFIGCTEAEITQWIRERSEGGQRRMLIESGREKLRGVKDE